MMCTTDAHCLDSNCGSCNATRNRCEHRAGGSALEAAAVREGKRCGASCVVDSDCGADGVKGRCGLCMNRVCSSGCSSPCAADGDCGDANCKVCDATKKTCGARPVPTPTTAAPVPPAGCGGECVV
eukprot:Sspe_Gene.30803::Locus_15216_Transcript_2_10_Confidence_0.643_Length_814::g.30803::m.30803